MYNIIMYIRRIRSASVATSQFGETRHRRTSSAFSAATRASTFLLFSRGRDTPRPRRGAPCTRKRNKCLAWSSRCGRTTCPALVCEKESRPVRMYNIAVMNYYYIVRTYFFFLSPMIYDVFDDSVVVEEEDLPT